MEKYSKNMDLKVPVYLRLKTNPVRKFPGVIYMGPMEVLFLPLSKPWNWFPKSIDSHQPWTVVFPWHINVSIWLFLYLMIVIGNRGKVGYQVAMTCISPVIKNGEYWTSFKVFANHLHAIYMVRIFCSVLQSIFKTELYVFLMFSFFCNSLHTLDNNHLSDG